MRSVWITGAGTGIGRAMAVRFAAAGAVVTLTGRRRDPLEAVAAEIAAAGGRARVAPADVLDRDVLAGLVDALVAETGALDVVANNAGINVAERHWSQVDHARWDELIDINVKGALNVIAAALPPMREQGGGLILNTASWAGRFYSDVSGVAYGASKHALMSINASLNSEEGKYGIRATALCPAEVATPLLRERPHYDEELAAGAIQPEDLAETALHIAQLPARIVVHEIVVAPVRR
ncbi:MAG: SDR family NAD(P)-dependent oxidoreductase [Alphaproteobacteria bacterium]|jgi:NADP-dependent 3-hydroxy acid dehydrogenase YdfG|nr:SDR family NAD(P)-dependent oxidoreductase [Alphaproteobacteria bacterium]